MRGGSFRLTEKGLEYCKLMVKKDPEFARCLAQVVVAGFIEDANEGSLPKAMIKLIRGAQRMLEEDGIDLADVLETLL